MAKYYESPIGVFVHPWFNKPDVKYNVDGVYHTGFRLTGPAAQAMKAKVDAQAQLFFDAFMEEKSFDAKVRKQWSIHYPYAVEEDDNGTPTGGILFSLKQSATIKIKATGEVKQVKIGLYDGANKEMHSAVWSGSQGRIKYSMRSAPQPTNKKVGVRLDFAAVQITQLQAGNSNGGFSSAVEGAYEEEEPADNAGFASSSSEAPSGGGGDY